MKWVKRILLVLLVLLLIAGGVVFYLWRQVTALPEWYAEEQAQGVHAPADAATIPDGPLVWKDAPAAAGAPAGKRKELRNFHRKAAARDPVVAKVIKASRASFEDGVLAMGVVADLRNLPNDSLRPADRELFEKVHSAFPSATDREIYIGVEDPAPLFTGGAIELGPRAQLVIGSLKYELDAAAGKMGMSPAALRKQWTATAQNLGVSPPTP